MVALAGSLSSLVFTFLPQLKPDPRDSVLAQVSVFAIEPGVSLRGYPTLTYGSVANAPRVAAHTDCGAPVSGDMIYVRTRVDGFKHRRVQVRAILYMKSTQDPARLLAGPVSGPAALRLRSVELDTPSTPTS